MSRSPRARDLELARVVASDPDVSAVRAALRELTRRAAEPRRKYDDDDDDDDDDDARADAEVEEIVRLVTYGTASHATAETRRACVEFAGTMLETTRNAAARRDESNQKRGEATKTEEEKDEQKMEEERRRARAERRRRRTRELFLEVLSARSREERDETTRRKIVDALMRATPVGTSSAREMMRALATVESFSRDDDAEAVVKALDAWTAMSDARIVALEGETDESTELARAVERVYWSVRSNCLAHRRREVRRAAVEACGALVTRVVLSRGDSRAHDAFGTSMLRLSVDEKSDVRRAVAFAVSRVFIARVNAGKFTIRDADADLLCAMFACDEETEEYAAERLREINAAHARKTMGEGCRSVAMFAVKEMLRCLKTHEVWDSDDARVRRARARAVARACEHLGDAVAPRVRDVLDILATMMNDDRNDALDVAHSALTYAPSIRRAWIRCVLDRVEEREDNGAALLEAVALSSYVLTWAASHELELDAKDIIDLLEVALRPEIAAAACRVVAVVDSCHKLLDVGAVVFADDQDVTQVRRDITAHSCTLTIIHASIYDVYEDDEIASQARRLSRMSTDGADEWRLIFNRLTTLFDDNSTSRAPSPRIGVDGACMTPEGVFAVFFECIRDGTLMKEVFDLVRRNVDASDKPPTARESEQSLLAAKSYIRVFDAYLCRTHVLDRLARRDVDGFDADFFPVFDALASRLRWNPRDAQFALGTLASTCFAHFCDEKQRCVLARWLASDGRADRVAEVIENFDCFACEERATAFAALHRALCEANPERARARLHAVARRALEVLNTGMKSERLLAVTCLSNALDALGDDASAGDYIARVFEFAADGDPDIRRATHDVLERARRHHSIRIRSLVVDSSDAKHADGLVGLKDAETPL
jgi:hypothetical protein